MNPELVVCIPGAWADRSDFLMQVINYDPDGRYMFAGMLLADTGAKDHLTLEFLPADSNLSRAFELAGQGLIPEEVMAKIDKHTAVLYLHFPLDLPGQRERILKYTQMMQSLGGIAVKVESSGVAHTWERWFELLSGSPFDVYCAAVTLISDTDYYYSCGMHQFGLPECEVPRSIENSEAAELMNRFNAWQIIEHPTISSGHTFSLNPTAPNFRLSLVDDTRHDAGHPFFNSNGIWRLDAA